MKKYLFLIISFFTALVASGATYYVVPGGAGNKNGTSWANAYADVQTAIDSASSAGGGEVWIAKGTYKHGSAMTMKNNVAIYGGFAGTETSKDQRVSGNNTILDGEGKYRVFDNNYTKENPLTNSAKLDNVTIQNGYSSDGAGMYNRYASPEITNCTFSGNSATGDYSRGGGMSNYNSSSPSLTNCTFSGNSASYDGGGMYNYSSSPVLTNCTFTNNSASSYYGGGMYNFSSSPTLTNCTFSGNSAYSGGGMYNYNYNSSSPELTNCTFTNNRAEYSGGGMWNDSSSPVLTNCTFSSNSASGSSYGYGGGMYNRSSSSPVLTNCTFTNNSASYGGGMYNDSSSPSLTNCTFSGNRASGSSYGYGGGMGNNSSSPVLTNCTFTNNRAEDYGGGMYNSSSSPTLTNCTFSNNSASYYGGGMYNKSSSSPVLTNCTFSNNSATGDYSRGGGMYNSSSSPTLTNCTFSNNSATGDYSRGGGMYNNSSSPSLTNCILWGNTASSSGNEIYNYNSSCNPTIDTCIIKGGYSSYGTYTNIITADPELMPLGNYGGSVQTCPVGAGSSAIGKGKKMSGVPTDARGYFRPSRGNPTIGAYEYNPIVPPSITTQPKELGVFINTDGSLSVSATGEEITYQWYFNGEAIEGATESTLSFDDIQFDKTGSYYCVITNPAGSVQSSTANVVVRQSATEDSITKKLEKVTTISGTGYARFVVETTAYNPTYKWYYGSGDTWTEFEETSNILFIPAESKYNRKNIKCEISNGGGSVSTQAVLVYSSTAIQITSQPQDVSFKLNENASFNVTVSTSTGNAYYQWQYSADSNEWQNIENATEATYSFKIMDSKNRGYYRCEIDNGGGVLYSENAKIIFPEDVAITTQPTAITSAIIGAKATFTVVVSGDYPKYQWQVSYDYGDTWENIAGATNGTLGVDVVENIVDNSYRCLVWNDNNVDAPLESEMVWIENVIEPTAFQEWSMANGLGVDASPSATPHNDGITNLEKFTFGLDASKATSYGANASFKHTSDTTGATLQFPVSVDAEGVVNVKALKSVDLINWTEATATATGETSSDGKFKIYKATAPVGEEGKVFLKLQVEEK